MDQFFGRIVDVQRKTEGDMLAAAAGVGATALTVYDTADFDETGGQLLLSGITYTYSAVDDATATITLTTPVTVAAAVDDPVDVLDSELGGIVVEYVAHVLLDENDPDDEPIEVSVQHALVPMLVEAVRGGAAESVTLVRDGDDDLMIHQVNGKLAEELVADQAAIDAAAAFDKATLALTETELAIAISDGRVNVYYQTTAPWAAGDATKDANLGDLWYDTDSGTIETRLAYRWMGQFNRNWVLVSDQSIVKALKDAQSAQTTADGKIVHFVSATAPTAEGYGDIWTNTAEDNKKYWWNGSAWAPLLVGDAAIAAALTGKIIRTALSGNRIQMRGDGAGGIIEFFSGVSGETAGYINPNQWSGSGIPGLSIAPGTSGSYTNRPQIDMAALSSGGGQIEFSGQSFFNHLLTAWAGVEVHGGLEVNSGGLRVWAGGLEVSGGSTQVNGLTASGELHGDTVYVDSVPTTASAANTFMGSAGQLQKSTSSKRYKKNIRNAGLSVDAILALKPRRFQSRSPSDGDGWFVGFVAEEAHDLGLTEFVVYDAEDRPDGFAYPAFTAALQAVCQSQQTQIDALTARIVALEAS